MPHGFDNTWGIAKDAGLVPSTSTLFFIHLFQVFSIVYFSHFSASVRPHIIDEQEAFIRQVTKIPLDEQRC